MTDQELIAIGKAAVSFFALVMKAAKIEPSGEDYLIAKYGECCTRVQAGNILDKDPGTISTMIRDGRLEAVCEGKKVCMHSIARYMEAPEQADFTTRLAKRNGGKLPRHYIAPSLGVRKAPEATQKKGTCP